MSPIKFDGKQVSVLSSAAELLRWFAQLGRGDYRLCSNFKIGIQLQGLCVILFFTSLQVFADESKTSPQLLRPLDSRNILFSRITPEDGLSQAAVNSIVQDHEGFIWFGTQEGLNKYDGSQIRIFEHDYNDPTTLSHDWVWSLFVDKAGTLWAGTDGGGLNRFDRAQNTFEHFRHDPENPDSLSSDRVRVIHQDRSGILWIGTDGGGLNRFDPKQGTFIRYQHDAANPQSISNDSVLAIHEDRIGNLWVGTNGGGLALLNRETGKFSHYRHNSGLVNSLSGDRVRSIFEDRSGRLWIGTYESGLNLFKPGTDSFKQFKHNPDDPGSLGHNRVRDIYQDRNDTLWIATDGGLNEWRADQQGFVRYTYDLKDPSSISDDRISTIFQDRGGVLWVGTLNGVNKWNYVSDVFTYYQEHGSKLKLSNNIVTSVSESKDGTLWVGNYGGGLNKLDVTSGQVTYYRKALDNANSLTDDRVMSVFVDQEQAVWVGTRNGGMSRMDPETEKFTHYQADPLNAHSLSSNSVTSILGESNGVLWAGTYGGGLNRLDPQTGKFKVYRHDPEDSSTLSSDRVLTVYRDLSGDLWIGTENGGINRLNESNGTFERFQHDPDKPLSLSSNTAWAILEGKDGSLWVGTGGGGLNRWTSASRRSGQAEFKKYRKSEGLNSDSIQSILEDNAGFIWLSSNHGLNRLEPATGSVRHFGRSSGLKANEFNFGAKLRGSTGKMFFGSTGGLVEFKPENIKVNQHQPDIALSAYTRLGPLASSYSTRPQTDTVELGYNEDLISFEFAGLDFSAPDQNRFSYKLEGFDKDWSPAVEFKRTTYTSLPSGNYTFRVKASNNDGIWSEEAGRMQFQVIPPPWKSLWAYGIYAFVVVGIILSYLRAQAMKFEREAKQRVELETQVERRTHELAQRNDQLLELNSKLKEIGTTDSLTGLKNRRYLHDYMEAEDAKLCRQVFDMKHPGNNAVPLDISPMMSFMMIDLDGFKAINDTYGHAAGDLALQQVRDILKNCCRQSDVITRWGGDEFLIVSRRTSASAAEKLAERIRKHLADHQYQLGNGNVGALSGSIGFAQYPFSSSKPDLVSWEQAITFADRAAYVVKQNGRNAWVGIFGARNITTEECSQIKSRLPALLGRGRVSIKTCIEGELEFDKLENTRNA